MLFLREHGPSILRTERLFGLAADAPVFSVLDGDSIHLLLESEPWDANSRGARVLSGEEWEVLGFSRSGGSVAEEEFHVEVLFLGEGLAFISGNEFEVEHRAKKREGFELSGDGRETGETKEGEHGIVGSDVNGHLLLRTTRDNGGKLRHDAAREGAASSGEHVSAAFSNITGERKFGFRSEVLDISKICGGDEFCDGGVVVVTNVNVIVDQESVIECELALRPDTSKDRIIERLIELIRLGGDRRNGNFLRRCLRNGAGVVTLQPQRIWRGGSDGVNIGILEAIQWSLDCGPIREFLSDGSGGWVETLHEAISGGDENRFIGSVGFYLSGGVGIFGDAGDIVRGVRVEVAVTPVDTRAKGIELTEGGELGGGSCFPGTVGMAVEDEGAVDGVASGGDGDDGGEGEDGGEEHCGGRQAQGG